MSREMRDLRTQVLQTQLALLLGAGVCLLFGLLVRASATAAAVYRPGTLLYFLGDVVFFTAPIVLWMSSRGGARRAAELAFVALLPVGGIVAMGQVARFDYLASLVYVMYPAMSVGVIGYLWWNARRSGRREVGPRVYR